MEGPNPGGMLGAEVNCTEKAALRYGAAALYAIRGGGYLVGIWAEVGEHTALGGSDTLHMRTSPICNTPVLRAVLV